MDNYPIIPDERGDWENYGLDVEEGGRSIHGLVQLNQVVGQSKHQSLLLDHKIQRMVSKIKGVVLSENLNEEISMNQI